jgi:hypothetical protein
MLVQIHLVQPRLLSLVLEVSEMQEKLQIILRVIMVPTLHLPHLLVLLAGVVTQVAVAQLQAEILGLDLLQAFFYFILGLVLVVVVLVQLLMGQTQSD